jgi:hypothetical protein
MKKVYQKEFYREPEMWSSNRYVVFRPNVNEGKAEEASDDSDDEPKVDDSDSPAKRSETQEAKDAEAAEEAKREKAEEMQGGTDIFYVVDSVNHNCFRIKNWTEENTEVNDSYGSAQRESKVKGAIFGKNVLAIALDDSIHYGVVDVEKALQSKNPYEIPEDMKKKYCPNKDGEEAMEI